MKRLNLTLLLVLLGSSLAFAAGLISRQAAENDALKAVGGGTVLQATLDSEGGRESGRWTLPAQPTNMKSGWTLIPVPSGRSLLNLCLLWR